MAAPDFVKTFCFSMRRADLINGALRPLCTYLETQDIPTLFINGSFVEEKLAPKDIDSFFQVTIAKSNVMFPSPNNYTDWRNAQSKIGNDTYVCCADEMPYSAIGKNWISARHYWNHQFGHTRIGTPKGFVSVSTHEIAVLEAV